LACSGIEAFRPFLGGQAPLFINFCAPSSIYYIISCKYQALLYVSVSNARFALNLLKVQLRWW